MSYPFDFSLFDLHLKSQIHVYPKNTVDHKMSDLYQVSIDLMILFFHINNRICFVLLEVKTTQKKEMKLLQEQKK